MTKEEQFELVQAALTGDQVAIERLYALAAPYLRRVIRPMLLDADVEDVLQEAMERIFRKLYSFRGEDCSFLSWATTIGVNQARMQLRDYKREKEVITTSLEASREPGEAPIDAPFEDRTLERREVHRIVHAALARIPQRQRRAVVMQMEGHSIEEIAAALGTTVSNSKSILLRGKRTLREAIENPRRAVRTSPYRRKSRTAVPA